MDARAPELGGSACSLSSAGSRAPDAPRDAEELTISALEALTFDAPESEPAGRRARTPRGGDALGLAFSAAEPPSASLTMDGFGPAREYSCARIERVVGSLGAAVENSRADVLRRGFTALQALALASPLHQESIASLGGISLLVAALRQGERLMDPVAYRECLQCVVSCTKGCHQSAVQFVILSGASTVMSMLKVFGLNFPHITELSCQLLSICIREVTTANVSFLLEHDSLTYFKRVLTAARDGRHEKIALNVLRILTDLLSCAHSGKDSAADDPKTTLATVQDKLRTGGMTIQVIQTAMAHFASIPMRHAYLSWVLAMIRNCHPNAAQFATLSAGDGIRLIFQAVGMDDWQESSSASLSSGFERTQGAPQPLKEPKSLELQGSLGELYLKAADALAGLTSVSRNKELVLEWNGIPNIVSLIRLVRHSSRHVEAALIALQRCAKASQRAARQAFDSDACQAIVKSMQSHRHSPFVQAHSIRALITLLQLYDGHRSDSCEAYAVQSVFFALTEHGKRADIVALSCRFFLLLSPFDIMSSHFELSDIARVAKLRWRGHEKVRFVETAVSELLVALDLVPEDIVESIALFIGTHDKRNNASGRKKRVRGVTNIGGGRSMCQKIIGCRRVSACLPFLQAPCGPGENMSRVEISRSMRMSFLSSTDPRGFKFMSKSAARGDDDDTLDKSRNNSHLTMDMSPDFVPESMLASQTLLQTWISSGRVRAGNGADDLDRIEGLSLADISSKDISAVSFPRFDGEDGLGGKRKKVRKGALDYDTAAHDNAELERSIDSGLVRWMEDSALPSALTDYDNGSSGGSFGIEAEENSYTMRRCSPRTDGSTLTASSLRRASSRHSPVSTSDMRLERQISRGYGRYESREGRLSPLQELASLSQTRLTHSRRGESGSLSDLSRQYAAQPGPEVPSQ